MLLSVCLWLWRLTILLLKRLDRLAKLSELGWSLLRLLLWKLIGRRLRLLRRVALGRIVALCLLSVRLMRRLRRHRRIPVRCWGRWRLVL